MGRWREAKRSLSTRYVCHVRLLMPSEWGYLCGAPTPLVDGGGQGSTLPWMDDSRSSFRRMRGKSGGFLREVSLRLRLGHLATTERKATW